MGRRRRAGNAAPAGAIAAGVRWRPVIVAALAGTALRLRRDGDSNRPKSDYAVTRDDQAGPGGPRDRRCPPAQAARRGRQAVAPSTRGNVIRRPIISMEQYLSTRSAGAIKRWNVVMVQIESLRSDQLRDYGGTRDVMPAVDALARESRVFTNAYIQASHSNYEDLVPLSSQYPLRSRGDVRIPAEPDLSAGADLRRLKASATRPRSSPPRTSAGAECSISTRRAASTVSSTPKPSTVRPSAMGRSRLRRVGQGNEERRQRRRPVHGGRGDKWLDTVGAAVRSSST